MAKDVSEGKTATILEPKAGASTEPVEGAVAAASPVEALVKRFPDPILIMDHNGKALCLNPGAKSLLSGDVLDPVTSHLTGVKTDAGVLNLRFRRASGDEMALRIKVAPIRWQGQEARLVSLRNITRYIQTIENLKRSLAESAAGTEQLQKRCASLEQLAKNALEDRAAAASTHEQAQLALTAASDELAGLREAALKNDELTEEIVLLKNELEQAIGEQKRAESALAESEEKAETLNAECEDLRATLTLAEDVEKERTKLAADLADMQKLLDEARAISAQKQTEAEQTEARRAELERKAGALEAELAKALTASKEAQGRIEALAQEIERQKGHVVEIERQLQESLQNADKTASEAVHRIAELEKARATANETWNRERSALQEESGLKLTRLEKEHAAAAEKWGQERKELQNKLDAQSNSAVSAGIDRKRLEHNLQTAMQQAEAERRKQEELQKALAAARTQLEQAQTASEGLKREAEAHRGKHEETQKALASAQAQLEQLRATHDTLRQEKEAANSKVKELEEGLLAQQSFVDDLKGSLDALSQNAQRAEEQRAAAEQEREEARREVETLQAECNELAEALTALHNHGLQAEMHPRSTTPVHDDVARLQEALSAAQQELEQERQKAAPSENDELARLQEALIVAQQELEKERQETARMEDAKDEAIERLQAEFNTLKAEHVQLKAAHDENEKQIVALIPLQNENDHLKSQVARLQEGMTRAQQSTEIPPEAALQAVEQNKLLTAELVKMQTQQKELTKRLAKMRRAAISFQTKCTDLTNRLAAIENEAPGDASQTAEKAEAAEPAAEQETLPVAAKVSEKEETLTLEPETEIPVAEFFRSKPTARKISEVPKEALSKDNVVAQALGISGKLNSKKMAKAPSRLRDLIKNMQGTVKAKQR